MKKILLTGSTGFIGSELLVDLSKDHKIYVILRKNKKILKNKNVTKVIYNNFKNLNNKLSKLRINTIIHCATHYVKKHTFDDIQKLNVSNILFGNVILENLKIMQVKNFINFSTVWENYDGKKGNYYNL
ncbi:MAG: NAD-dependent epimerase/dehydratase family protein, partial [Candidatus Pelagibacter sp.]